MKSVDLFLKKLVDLKEEYGGFDDSQVADELCQTICAGLNYFYFVTKHILPSDVAAKDIIKCHYEHVLSYLSTLVSITTEEPIPAKYFRLYLNYTKLIINNHSTNNQVENTKKNKQIQEITEEAIKFLNIHKMLNNDRNPVIVFPDFLELWSIIPKKIKKNLGKNNSELYANAINYYRTPMLNAINRLAVDMKPNTSEDKTKLKILDRTNHLLNYDNLTIYTVAKLSELFGIIVSLINSQIEKQQKADEQTRAIVWDFTKHLKRIINRLLKVSLNQDAAQTIHQLYHVFYIQQLAKIVRYYQEQQKGHSEAQKFHTDTHTYIESTQSTSEELCLLSKEFCLDYLLLSQDIDESTALAKNQSRETLNPATFRGRIQTTHQPQNSLQTIVISTYTEKKAHEILKHIGLPLFIRKEMIGKDEKLQQNNQELCFSDLLRYVKQWMIQDAKQQQILRYVKKLASQDAKQQKLSIELTSQPQVGQICKLVSIANIETHYAKELGFEPMPLTAKKTGKRSIRWLAKQNGSTQGEILEFSRWNYILSQMGYKTEVVNFTI